METMPEQQPQHSAGMQQIPMEGSAEVIMNLLKLVYSKMASTELDELFQFNRQCFMDVMAAAHKYTMPEVIERMETYLLDYHKEYALLQTAEDAIEWAVLASDLELSRLLEVCEKYISVSSVSAAKCRNLSRLPSKSLARIFQTVVHAHHSQSLTRRR